MKNQVRAIRLNSSLRSELIGLIADNDLDFKSQLAAIQEEQKKLGDKIYFESYQPLVEKMLELRDMLGVNLEDFRPLYESNFFQVANDKKTDFNVVMTDKRLVLQMQPLNTSRTWAIEWKGMETTLMMKYKVLVNASVKLQNDKALHYVEIKNIVNNCNTLRQLEEAAPEWVQYFPSYLLLNE